MQLLQLYADYLVEESSRCFAEMQSMREIKTLHPEYRHANGFRYAAIVKSTCGTCIRPKPKIYSDDDAPLLIIHVLYVCVCVCERWNFAHRGCDEVRILMYGRF